jgi:methyltransferase
VNRTGYTVLVGAVGVQRLAELAISRRNAAWAFARGGVETGRGHLPAMIVLHTGLLVGAAAEARFAHRRYRPALGATMLVLLAGCQGVRAWCIAALGRRWNTRVIVLPGVAPVTSGPYRRLAHPNYAAVVVEGVALPLVYSAWVTVGAFTLANAGLLTVRIRVERRALAQAAAAAPVGTETLP